MLVKRKRTKDYKRKKQKQSNSQITEKNIKNNQVYQGLASLISGQAQTTHGLCLVVSIWRSIDFQFLFRVTVIKMKSILIILWDTFSPPSRRTRAQQGIRINLHAIQKDLQIPHPASAPNAQNLSLYNVSIDVFY